MRIIRGISAHEMARRFAIGEINSNFFHSKDEPYKQETVRLLTSGDPTREVQGIQRHWQTRRAFVNSLPGDTQWNLARLDLAKDEFARLETIRDTGWINYTGGSLKLVEAANSLQLNPNRDPRVAAIVSACKQGKLDLRGITLLGQTDVGPFTIVEGSARLVALYLCCVLSTSSPICANDIEVVVGLSPTRWSWSQPRVADRRVRTGTGTDGTDGYRRGYRRGVQTGTYRRDRDVFRVVFSLSWLAWPGSSLWTSRIT